MNRKIKNLLVVLCVVLIILVMFNPDKYINSCLKGFIIFGNKVLPALFPFFFLTKILCETNLINKISNKMNFITKKFYNTSGHSCYIFLMSIISGYPVGAKLTADFYEKELIDKNEAFRITTFTSTSGPIFIIGTVGVGMFSNSRIALIILISHILGSLINGLFYRNFGAKTIKKQNAIKNKIETNTLSDCMYNSLISIMMVGGVIAFFTVVIDALLSVPLFFNSNLKIIVSGFVEITRGCFELSQIGFSKTLITVLATFFISFGGLSIHAQALTFLKRCEIKTGMFVLQKFTHALISCLISLILCFIIL